MAKMKYKSSLSYPNEGTNATPFNNNLKEFDEFIGESRKRERAWRRVALRSSRVPQHIGRWDGCMCHPCPRQFPTSSRSNPGANRNTWET